MQYRELVLLEKLQALTAADADLEYSVLRGKLDQDDVRAIHQGLQIAIETLRAKATPARLSAALRALRETPRFRLERDEYGWWLKGCSDGSWVDWIEVEKAIVILEGGEQ